MNTNIGINVDKCVKMEYIYSNQFSEEGIYNMDRIRSGKKKTWMTLFNMVIIVYRVILQKSYYNSWLKRVSSIELAKIRSKSDAGKF